MGDAGRGLGARVHKLIRRVHLYLGLALLPWVLLYGLTALLFNNGTWWTESVLRGVSADEATRAADALPAPDALAEETLARLLEGAAQEHPDADFAPKLVPGSARWRGALSFQGRRDDVTARLNVDPLGRGGRLRLNPRKVGRDEPDWADEDHLEDWEPLPDALQDALVAAAADVTDARRLELERLSLRELPDLRFVVEDADGSFYRCDLEPDGSFDADPLEDGPPLRDRLTRLHKQHGDPGHLGPRSLWSTLVDVMGCAMIVWALTGLVMWWTIKPTRRAGLVAIASGVAALVTLALALLRATS